MDFHYLYSLVSFLVGVLSGFQFIVGKYRKTPFLAARTFPGLVYLATRGAIASIAFVALYATSVITGWLIMWALITGASAEILLRTKFFVLEKENPSGVSEEIMLGPLNLLIFFQDFFLEGIKERLSIAITRDRMKMVREFLPKDLGFEKLYERVNRNLEAWEDDGEKEGLRPDLKLLHQEYLEVRAKGPLEPELDEIYKEKLGYRLLQLGNQKFKLLVSKPPQTGEQRPVPPPTDNDQPGPPSSKPISE